MVQCSPKEAEAVNHARRSVAVAVLGLSLAVAALTVLLSCSNGGGGGGGEAAGGNSEVPAAFSITGKTFSVPLAATGVFDLSGTGDAVRKAAAIGLFTTTPTDSPSSGTFFLDASDVQATGQAGTFLVNVRVGHGSSANPCDEGEDIGSFSCSYDGQAVTLGVGELSLIGMPLSCACSGSFTLCLETSGPAGARLEITTLGVRFGPSSGLGDNENDNMSDEAEWEPIEGPPPVVLEIEPNTRVTKSIPAATGGALTAVGSRTMTLEIPPGALPADTEVSMTILSDSVSGRGACVAMFEPNGLVLNTPATLTITLPQPLPLSESLNQVQIGSADPDDFLDTGVLATLSEDRTTVRIPVTHFSGDGYYVNCHAQSLRRIVQSLTRPLEQGGRGLTKADVINEIQITLGNKWVPRKPEWTDAEYEEEVRVAYANLNTRFDAFASNDADAYANAYELMAFLNTFYSLGSVRLDPERASGGEVITDAAGNAVVHTTNPKCIVKLAALAGRKDHLPPIVLLDSSFRVGGASDANASSADGPVIYDGGFSHSAPIMLRDGSVQIEQGVELTKEKADALQAAREAYRDANPGRWQAQGISMPSRGVVPVELTTIDRLRSWRSGALLNDEYSFWTGEPAPLVTESRALPWVSARIWIPQGTYVDLCKECTLAAQCTDRVFCNGDEVCQEGLCDPGSEPCPASECDEDADECRDGQGGGGGGLGGGTCWEVSLHDLAAHVDEIEGLPPDVDPGDIPRNIPVSDQLSQGGRLILQLDVDGQIERLWVRSTESVNGIDTIEFLRLTVPNVDLLPGQLVYSDVYQDVGLNEDGSEVTFAYGFTQTVTAQGTSATGSFAYELAGGGLAGSPPDRFGWASYSSEMDVRGTNPETGSPVHVRVTTTGLADGVLLPACPDPASSSVLSQEEVQQMAEDQSSGEGDVEP